MPVTNKLEIIEEHFINRLNQIYSLSDGTVTIEENSNTPIDDSPEATVSVPTSQVITGTATTLMKMPLSTDILFILSSFLDIESLISLASTCKDASLAVRNFSKVRVMKTNPHYTFNVTWINLLILAIIYEFELPFDFNFRTHDHDQLYLLLFKFLHCSTNVNNQMYRAVMSFIYKSVKSPDANVPMTQKQWRLSLIRHFYQISQLPLTISALQSHYQVISPSFTENFVDWLDLLEFFASNPSRNDLIRLRNVNHSANHYLHDDLEEDFKEIIDEVLRV